MEGVTVFLDDILVSGRTLIEHVQRLKLILDRLAQSGLKVKLEKLPRTSEIAENNVLRSTELNKQHRGREFVVGDEVLAKDFSNSSWTSGTVIKRDGNVLYDVQAEESKILRRHADQLILTPKVSNRRSCPLAAFATDFNEGGAGESSSKVSEPSQDLALHTSATSDSTVPQGRYNLRPRDKN
ncbi:hypothetical protein QE152_g31387 [Popillia japonica]|uniref:Reverse transcriptase domain-containing protein n=1 Tax=Popillia japonica TaxID=7064 RepID=A0AAW1J129_POPJA